MGDLRRHPIEEWRKEYGLSVLVETGTYRGAGVRTALRYGFPEVYTIEINDKYFKEATAKFAKDPVIVMKGNTIDVIGRLVASIALSNVMFWLDAHLPQITGYNQETTKETRWPLQSELKEIKKNRNISGDVFIIDDLRMYELGDYGAGNVAEEHQHIIPGSIDFIFDLLGDTHNIERDMRNEGYVICLPKEKRKVEAEYQFMG